MATKTYEQVLTRRFDAHVHLESAVEWQTAPHTPLAQFLINAYVKHRENVLDRRIHELDNARSIEIPSPRAVVD